MKKNLFLSCLILGFSLVFVACGSSKNETATTKSTTIKIGHVEPEDRSTHRVLLDFKKEVEEKSNGSILVEIFPNGALGGDIQLTESVAMGALDAALPSTSVLTTYGDDFGILDMPYLFKNSQNAFNALDGEMGEYFDKKLIGHGIYNLGYSYNGARSTTTNTKPIEKVSDLKGVKMRVMESPVFIDYYKTLEANPTPMSFTELYTGLQQGTVEAQENAPSLVLAMKVYEVQKYYSIDEHVHNFLSFLINKNKFDSLTEEQKNIVSQAAKNYVDNQRKMEIEDTSKAIEELEARGLKVNYLNEGELQKFKEKLKPMYDKYEKKFGRELFEKAEKYNN